jgi:hypothetical protein
MRIPFKAVREVVDPSGEYWGIYVSRVAPVGWKEGKSGFDDSPVDGREAIAELPLMLMAFLWSSILVPLLRLILLTPFAIVRGRRSNCVWIYAETLYGGSRETRIWTTTSLQTDGVVDEIATALQQGKVAQPAGAVYSGSREN